MRGWRVLPHIGDSLGQRLIGLFALILLPPTVLSIYLAWDAYREHTERAKLSVRQLTTLAATYERNFFEDTRTLLQQLAQEPEVKKGEPQACKALLAKALERKTEFSRLALHDPEGAPMCGTSDGLESAVDRSWFREVRRYHSFTISNYTFVSGSRYPVIVAALPVYDETNEFRGVLSASIELYWLGNFLREARLPSKGIFFLLDSNGNVLANSSSFSEKAQAALPKTGADAGEKGAPAQRIRPSAIQQDVIEKVVDRQLVDFEAIGNDGVRRVYSSVALPHGDVLVLFGAPADAMLGWIKEDLAARIFSITAIWLAGIGAAWLGVRYLVTRWTGALRRTALSYAAGDYSAKVDFDGAPAELRDLSHTLMLMGERIQDREAELRGSLVQKDTLLREIHHRVKNNLQVVSSLLNLRAKSVSGADTRLAIDEIRMRVQSLAILHHYLYESDDLRLIDLQSFINELCQTLIHTLTGYTTRIALEIDVSPLKILSDRATPIALLVTEAVTNSLKHGFADGRSGRIMVSLTTQNHRSATLVIADDGIGLPRSVLNGESASSSPHKSRKGRGIDLIRAFARQVGGELKVYNASGSRLEITLDLAILTSEAQLPPAASDNDYAERLVG